MNNEAFSGALLPPAMTRCSSLLTHTHTHTPTHKHIHTHKHTHTFTHPCHSSVHQCSAARGCPAVVIARLQRHVRSGTLSVVAGSPQGIDLSMRHASFRMEAFPHDLHSSRVQPVWLTYDCVCVLDRYLRTHLFICFAVACVCDVCVCVCVCVRVCM